MQKWHFSKYLIYKFQTNVTKHYFSSIQQKFNRRRNRNFCNKTTRTKMTELLTCDGNLFQIKNCHSDNVTTQFCSPSTFFFANTLYKCFKRGNDIYCSCLVLDWLINHNSINKITITRTEKKINCIKLHHNIHVINHIFFIRCM